LIASNINGNIQVNLHNNIEKMSVFSGIFSQLVHIQGHLNPARDFFLRNHCEIEITSDLKSLVINPPSPVI
jgi:hypothetical protein